ncbi:MAG: hypothetical protein K2X00_20840, partial [Nitrospiraceae bacterium]|nr:hypothetical protein [Nitrospiraceae bacterium]
SAVGRVVSFMAGFALSGLKGYAWMQGGARGGREVWQSLPEDGMVGAYVSSSVGSGTPSPGCAGGRLGWGQVLLAVRKSRPPP